VRVTVINNDPDLDANLDADATDGIVSALLGPAFRRSGGGGPTEIRLSPAVSTAGRLPLLAGRLGLGGFYHRRRRFAG
jgi:hypothetical protein